MIFNSFGSAYSWRFASRFLFARPSLKDSRRLKTRLAEDYVGRAYLYYRGRSAIAEAIRILKAKKVLINGFSCYAVEQAVREAGSQAIFADIQPDSFHFELPQLKAAHKDNPDLKAIIVQNTFGLSLAIEPLIKYCRQHGIYIIEDLAHGLRGEYLDGNSFGQISDITVLSFGRGKQIDVVSGGALIIRSKAFSARPKLKKIRRQWRWRILERFHPLFYTFLKFLYKHNLGGLYWHHFFNLSRLLTKANDGPFLSNIRLPDYRSRFILEGLDKLTQNISSNLKLKNIYEDVLSPQIAKNRTQHLIRFPYLLKDQAMRRLFCLDLKKDLKFNLNDIWYDKPVSPARFQAVSDYALGSCPIKDKIIEQIINLPLHSEISESLAKQIALKLKLYARYTLKTEFTSSGWSEILSQFDSQSRNLLTSDAELRAYEEEGKRVFRFVLYEEEKPVALMVAVLVKAKRASFLKLAGNPLFLNRSRFEKDILLRQIKLIAKEHRVDIVRLQTYLLDNKENSDFLNLRSATKDLNARHTFKLDLRTSLEDIFAGAKFAKARAYIRKGRKMNLSLSLGQDKAALEDFLELLLKTQSRQNFLACPLDFIRAQFKTYVAEDKFRIYLAKKDDRILAGACILDDDCEAVYLYGASLKEGQKLYATYVLQWQAISDAQARGLRTYNFWGAAPEGASIKHRFYGLSQFKKNFGGQHLSYLPTKDLVLNLWRYWLFIRWFEIYEKRRRHL